MKAGLPKEGPVETDEDMDGPAAPEDAELLRLAQAAETQAKTFARQNWGKARDQAYKSFRSEYVKDSKYKSDDYRNRSKIFRPKTRIAVTKDMAGAAQTLFNTTGMVTVSPGDETDEVQVANAELIQALVDYRLDRTSRKNAIPWFLTSMGALQDCKIAGICCSKQYWAYQEREKFTVEFTKDPATGQTVTRKVKKTVKIKDKPEIELLPPENLGLDPAASWLDPVNSGAYFYAKYPMHVQDVKDMMADPRNDWRPLTPGDDGKTDDSVFHRARVEEFASAEVRRSREGGVDRMDNTTSTAREFDVVWVVEWFIRTQNEDWCFWTLGASHMLSEPKPTEEAYPCHGGERPYRIGYGNLEAHRIVPQSPVETLQPLQQEINDITNLRLDNLKQVIQPVAIVRRGKKIDTDALKRRYPVLFVENPKEDIQWDRPPDSAASSFAETSRLDTDFDDLAGTFNGGSVANNRQIGETVGGMRLMAGAAGAVSEFYVRLWVETWVEPVVGDVAKLIAYYESDEKILALAAKRAPSFKEFGVDAITDELLMQEVIVRVSAGVGSPDPMQKMAKLGQAFQLMEGVVKLDRRFMTGEIRPNTEALVNEIFGNAGMRDGFDRFFEFGEPIPQPGQQPEPNPAADPAVLADKKAERDSKESIAKLKAKADITKTLITHKAGQRSQERDHKKEGKHKFTDLMLQMLMEQQGAQERSADREVAAKQKPAPSAA